MWARRWQRSRATGSRSTDEIESAGSDAFVTDGVGDKLRERIRRLVALIKKVATEWGAIHYSIGVSLEGLSLSVEWAAPKGADREGDTHLRGSARCSRSPYPEVVET